MSTRLTSKGAATKHRLVEDLVGGFRGHVETGTIGDHVGSWFRSGFFGENRPF